MRVLLFTPFGALRTGLNILFEKEGVEVDEIRGHGGFFKTREVGQKIMNQMIGASSTSLSNILGHAIDITPPNATCVGADSDISEMLDGSHLVIKVSFDMEIEGLLKSKLMQLIPI
jgi:hypothetical protein